MFCPKCKRLKIRCICQKESIRDKNIKLLEKVAGKRQDLLPIFDTTDEIIYYEILNPFNPKPEVPLDKVQLDERSKAALKSNGITKLYQFQEQAIEEIKKGKNVVIVAPTGFGKTEAFIIPVLEKIYENKGKAMVLYPTKALARDQEEKIKFYSFFFGLETVRFDGDSTEKERRKVLGGEADIILTNPDMVDYHLRNTVSFRRIMRKIQFIVVDELHSYVGLLGSNVHYIIKRLERFSNFKIICSSATIANPSEFAEELFDRKFVLIKANHRKGKQHFIMIYTPSFYSTIKELVKKLKNKKILIFGNSYKSVETIGWILSKEKINAAIHKGGLPRKIREKVEREFKHGITRVVVSTPTLELGIDIGDVDVVISELVSYPHFLQRAGRAGRKGQESLGILILRDDDAISNYYKIKPYEYFKDKNYGYIEKLNEEVMKYQLLSMIIEKSLSEREIKKEWRNIVDYLVNRNFVKKVRGKYSAAMPSFKYFADFSIRGIGESIKMIANGEIIGERQLPIALKELFPGSIIIHNKKRWKCTHFDLKNKKAYLKEHPEGLEITQPLYVSIPCINEIKDRKKSIVDVVYCNLKIKMIIYGFVEKNVFTKEKLNIKYLDHEIVYEFPTKGLLFSAPYPSDLSEDRFPGTFHALEHVLIESSDSLTGGGSNLLGGISVPNGDIFVYDGVIGGCGLSKLLFKRIEKALEIAYFVLKNCDCKRKDGCPKCTYSYSCGNNNQPLDREGALEVLNIVLKEKSLRKTEAEKYKKEINFEWIA
ncbi:RNA helicase [Candidatus Bathyarchaeota archaeon]|nr:MAG: RNA helicase [Candidatus Bathyarchaeota archaeon]